MDYNFPSIDFGKKRKSSKHHSEKPEFPIFFPQRVYFFMKRFVGISKRFYFLSKLDILNPNFAAFSGFVRLGFMLVSAFSLTKW
jgi:hypothetical protein